MRQMHNTFRQSIAIQQAFQEAKNQSTIIRSTPPVETQPEESVVESQPESIVEEVKPVVEEPKVEQPKTTSRLPSLGK